MGSIIGYRRNKQGEYVEREIPIDVPTVLHTAAARDLCASAIVQVGQASSMQFGGRFGSHVDFVADGGEAGKRQQRGTLTIRTEKGRVEVGPVTLDATALEQLNVPVPPEPEPVPVVEDSAGVAAIVAVRLVAQAVGASLVLDGERIVLLKAPAMRLESTPLNLAPDARAAFGR